MHYPIDVVPSFWGRVVDLANNGLVISIDKVYSELAMGRDDLYGWCGGNLSSAFFHDTKSVIEEYANLTQWAASKVSHYTSGRFG